MNNRSLCALLLVLAPMTNACTAGPNYAPPQIAAAPAWRAPLVQGERSAKPWWTGFGDPVLDRLQAEALAGNLTIEQAFARLDQASAAAAGAGAARLPVVQAEGSAARTQQSLNAGLGQLSRYVPDLPRAVNSGSATLNTSWDLDFAGGLRRRQEAARAGVAEAQAGIAAAKLAVTAELADAYFRMRASEARLSALQVIASAAQERRKIVAVRRSTGAASQAEDERAEASAAQAEAQLPAVSALIEAETARIAVLVGRSASLPPDLAGGFAYEAPDPVAGLPAAVLRSRPDVAAAEARLVAGNAAIGAAMAEYYPSLSLGGLIGLQSNRFGEWLNGDSLTAQGAVGLRWRLFDFGRIDAQVASARGRTRELLAAYRETVLRASADVESSYALLAASRESVTRTSAENRARRAARDRDAVALRAGAGSRDTLLLSDSAVADADIRLAQAKAQQALAIVALSRALGLSVGEP